jgi:hypothetical protein
MPQQKAAHPYGRCRLVYYVAESLRALSLLARFLWTTHHLYLIECQLATNEDNGHFVSAPVFGDWQNCAGTRGDKIVHLGVRELIAVRGFRDFTQFPPALLVGEVVDNVNIVRAIRGYSDNELPPIRPSVLPVDRQ